MIYKISEAKNFGLKKLLTQEHKIAMQLKKTRPVIAVYGTHTQFSVIFAYIHSEIKQESQVYTYWNNISEGSWK